jgi:hypothetical protein
MLRINSPCRYRELPELRRQAAGGRSCASCARGIRASLHVIACIDDPPLIAKILGHVRSRAPATAIQVRGPPADAQQALQLT